MALRDLNPSMPPSRPTRPGRPAAPPAADTPPPSPPPPPPPLPPKPAVAPAPKPEAPADFLRTPARWVRAAWYAGTVALTLLLLAGGLRFDELDIRAPIAYDGDVLLIMPMVKATLERGLFGHWRNERMGYPGVQELYDFPVVDHLHLAAVWLIGRVVSDWVVVYNLYFLMTWPLTALTAMYAFRRLGLTLPFAAAGAVAFAFLPYHFMRGESHYFLAAYWVVPLSWLPALAILRGDLPFFRRDRAGAYHPAFRSRGALAQLLIAAATATAGAYYAFFACALYGFAGVYGWLAHRTGRAAASAAVLVALVVGLGVAQHAPAVVYAIQNGRNSATERQADESEAYALKIAHMVLPVEGHNLNLFARVRSMYNSPGRPLNNENGCATLGLVGTAGLLVLVATVLLPNRAGWPYRPLAAAAAFVLLFATVGGFGSVFSLLVFDQIRCLNRFSIYLAFVCLLAALWPIDLFLAGRKGWARWLRVPAAAVVAALAVADQTPAAWFDEQIIETTERDAERFRADRRFFERVEDQLGPGARVFTLPYVPYPEVPAVNGMNTYEHARVFLHTNTLVSGYGAMKNRAVDAWHESVAYDPAPERLRRMVVRGFDAVFIDGRGYATAADANALVAALKAAAAPAGLPELVHEDGRQVVFDLRPYRDWLMKQDPAYFEREAKREREWATVTWLHGFANYEEYGARDRLRWASRTATAVVVNPSDRTRTFVLAATFGTDGAGPFLIRIDGGGLVWADRSGGPGPWADEFVVDKPKGAWDPGARIYGVPRMYRIEVPPGRHRVRFHCTPPPKFLPTDGRPLCFFLKDVRFEEVK